jgi:hypothetical protein
MTATVSCFSRLWGCLPVTKIRATQGCCAAGRSGKLREQAGKSICVGSAMLFQDGVSTTDMQAYQE